MVQVAEWWRITTEAVAAAVRWAGRTVRPAGVVVVVAATVGLLLGVLFGWVEWMVAGSAA